MGLGLGVGVGLGVGLGLGLANPSPSPSPSPNTRWERHLAACAEQLRPLAQWTHSALEYLSLPCNLTAWSLQRCVTTPSQALVHCSHHKTLQAGNCMLPLRRRMHSGGADIPHALRLCLHSAPQAA